MTHRLPTFLSMLFAVLFLFAGCANREPSGVQTEVKPGSHWFDLSIGRETARVQLAVTRREMARGLMERTRLEADQGMLFVYARPIRASFWMKNTPLPLDIGFFSPEGVLLEVYPLYPYDEESVRSRSDQVQFALEMNQGWFSRNQIRPGAVLDQERLRQALRTRGFEPAGYGL